MIWSKIRKCLKLEEKSLKNHDFTALYTKILYEAFPNYSIGKSPKSFEIFDLDDKNKWKKWSEYKTKNSA